MGTIPEMARLGMSLKWKRVWQWDLSRQEQTLWAAQGRDVQYKITRAGTADKPWWRLYTRLPDGTEECVCGSTLLSHTKSFAVESERTQHGGH
jgi:hypothetical protein